MFHPRFHAVFATRTSIPGGKDDDVFDEALLHSVFFFNCFPALALLLLDKDEEEGEKIRTTPRFCAVNMTMNVICYK